MTAPPEITTYYHSLRRAVLHLLVDLDLAGPKFSNLPKLAAELSEYSGRRISRASLSLALSGGRQGKKYVEYLATLQWMLRRQGTSIPVSNNTICEKQQEKEAHDDVVKR